VIPIAIGRLISAHASDMMMSTRIRINPERSPRDHMEARRSFGIKKKFIYFYHTIIL
jgi:hypothetical protein